MYIISLWPPNPTKGISLWLILKLTALLLLLPKKCPKSAKQNWMQSPKKMQQKEKLCSWNTRCITFAVQAGCLTLPKYNNKHLENNLILSFMTICCLNTLKWTLFTKPLTLRKSGVLLRHCTQNCSSGINGLIKKKPSLPQPPLPVIRKIFLN